MINEAEFIGLNDKPALLATSAPEWLDSAKGVLAEIRKLPGAILFGFPVMTAVGAGVYVLAAVVAAPVARRLVAAG